MLDGLIAVQVMPAPQPKVGRIVIKSAAQKLRETIVTATFSTLIQFLGNSSCKPRWRRSR